MLFDMIKKKYLKILIPLSCIFVSFRPSPPFSFLLLVHSSVLHPAHFFFPFSFPPCLPSSSHLFLPPTCPRLYLYPLPNRRRDTIFFSLRTFLGKNTKFFLEKFTKNCKPFFKCEPWYLAGKNAAHNPRPPRAQRLLYIFFVMLMEPSHDLFCPYSTLQKKKCLRSWPPPLIYPIALTRNCLKILKNSLIFSFYLWV